MIEKNKHKMGDKFNQADQNGARKEHDLDSEIKNESLEAAKKEIRGREGIRAAGEKIKKTIKIFQLKKKLDWIRSHVLENNKPPQTRQIGPEQKKLQVLLKELEMLKRFNTLGFDSDAINLLLGLYYMVEMIGEEGKISDFLANGTVPEEKKSASLESLLHEWWERVELLPSYKERTAVRYQHLGTKVVIEKLYSKRKFVDPLNNIIDEINEFIKKRDIEGLKKAVKKSELFCEEIKKMARRPEKREYTGPFKIDEPKQEEKE